MTKIKNIFDINDISDLPEEVRRKLITTVAVRSKKLTPSPEQGMIASVLTDLKDGDVTVKNIQVAMYRKLGVFRSYSQISTAVHQMVLKGLLVRTERGRVKANG